MVEWLTRWEAAASRVLWRICLGLFLVLAFAVPINPATPEANAQGFPSVKLIHAVQDLTEKANGDEKLVVVIKLADPDLSAVRRDDVIGVLEGHASRTQRPLLDFLKDNQATVLNTFWLTNAVLAEIPLNLLHDIASRPDVKDIFENFEVTIFQPATSTPAPLSGDVTWGLDRINAPEIWDMGITGSGVRVAVLDTGVDISHPDLTGKMWTDDPADPSYPGGWIEFNSAGNIVLDSVPHDTHKHGTHTSGTVVGGDASGTAIGVAPGAWLMHGLILPGGSGTFAQVIAGMEWAINPLDQFGNAAGEPADVISMSFRAGGHHDEMIEPIENMKAAGVVPVASIGNDGAGTSGCPGNVYAVFGIGATDSNDSVASFSSGEVVNWPASFPEPYIKPDFAAPGVNVLSSIPGGHYDYLSGTSMAAPHVAGVVALMKEANNTLGVADVYDALQATADDLGDAGQDIRYGWGIVDAFDAASLVNFNCGVEGVVSDAETGLPVEDAGIVVSETGQARHTDSFGHYRLLLRPGTYTVIASRFGYETQVVTATVVEGVFTAQNFAFVPVPTGTIAGTVIAMDSGAPVSGVTVVLLSTPLSATTDAMGHYSLKVPEGAYDVAASKWGYKKAAAEGVSVLEGETTALDFQLASTLRVAVLGDYNLQLVQLLDDASISAEQTDWSVVDNVESYDVIIVNHPSDPGRFAFLNFLDVTEANGTGLIFTSSWPGTTEPYGISLLQRYLSDPAMQGDTYGKGTAYYEVTRLHPLFAGWTVGDRIDLITSGECDYAWFQGYSGETIADIGAQLTGITGSGVGMKAVGTSLHILLAGLAPQAYAHVEHWSQDARTVIVRAVLLAGGQPQIGVHPLSFDETLDWGQIVTTAMTISNLGDGALQFEISDVDLETGLDATWLSQNPISGSTIARGDCNTSVTLDATGLAPGTYGAEIIIDSNDLGLPQVIIPVAATVSGSAPEIDVTPVSFNEKLEPGQLLIKTMTINNVGEGMLDFDISDVDLGSGLDSTWLSLAPVSGLVAPGESQGITVTFDGTDLVAGSYTADIIIGNNDPDENPITVSATLTVPAADIDVVVPEPLDVDLNLDQVETRIITINNYGEGTLLFEIIPEYISGPTAGDATGDAVIHHLELAKGEDDPRRGQVVIQGTGGPDGFGYYWIDSDQPGGPRFQWVEIEHTGTDTGIHGDDDAVVLDMGFDFSFYGNTYSQVMIAEDGFISFIDYGSSSCTNQPIPDPSTPNNIIAPFWDDQYTPAGGTIYYHMVEQGGHRLFAVEWSQVPHYSSPLDSILTYQLLLSDTGEVVFQYKTMTGEYGDAHSATVGIENPDGWDGLEVSFNTPFIHDEMAVLIAPHPFWLRTDPCFGTVAPGENQNVEVIFDSRGLRGGSLSGNIIIKSNDPDEEVVVLSASLQVCDSPTADFVANITTGVVELDVQLTDQSTGHVTEWSWDFGDGGTSTEQNPFHTYTSAGLYTVSLTVRNSLVAGTDTKTKTDYIAVYRRGDANRDGNVNSLDITKVERIIMELDDPTPGADANGDGNMNALDITKIELIIMGG